MHDEDPAQLVCVISDKPRIAISFSAGIRAIRHVASLVGVDRVCSPSQLQGDADVLAVLVWGRKQNSAKARRFARSQRLANLVSGRRVCTKL